VVNQKRCKKRVGSRALSSRNNDLGMYRNALQGRVIANIKYGGGGSFVDQAVPSLDCTVFSAYRGHEHVRD
jgi:hypothetical protein